MRISILQSVKYISATVYFTGGGGTPERKGTHICMLPTRACILMRPEGDSPTTEQSWGMGGARAEKHWPHSLENGFPSALCLEGAFSPTLPQVQCAWRGAPDPRQERGPQDGGMVKAG